MCTHEACGVPGRARLVLLPVLVLDVRFLLFFSREVKK